jgi:hypothetical protein
MFLGNIKKGVMIAKIIHKRMTSKLYKLYYIKSNNKNVKMKKETTHHNKKLE